MDDFTELGKVFNFPRVRSQNTAVILTSTTFINSVFYVVFSMFLNLPSVFSNFVISDKQRL